jgi:hypothetical protein
MIKLITVIYNTIFVCKISKNLNPQKEKKNTWEWWTSETNISHLS